jgi:hypothetical protein
MHDARIHVRRAPISALPLRLSFPHSIPFALRHSYNTSRKIEISKGEADINVVVKDILSLTKLNYNTCIFGDGMPITLKFADAVGEILTAGPIKDIPPLPFGHYI